MGKRSDVSIRHLVRSKSHRSAKRARRPIKMMASVGQSGREIIRAAMKGTKAKPRVYKKGSSQGLNGADGAGAKPAPVFQHPKSDLEAAIQRYVDLFDFAPIGYVTFDRVGRIEEINFAAVELVGRSRKQLIGATFAVCVARNDAQFFLHHLLQCRLSDAPVVTELRLQRPDGQKFPFCYRARAVSHP